MRDIKKGFICLTICLGVVLGFSSLASARVFYVADSGNNQDGRSWTNAYTSLGDAVNAVQDGDEIWVKQGTYYTAQITISQTIVIYGGFDGTETDRSARDWATRPPVLLTPAAQVSDRDRVQVALSQPAPDCFRKTD